MTGRLHFTLSQSGNSTSGAFAIASSTDVSFPLTNGVIGNNEITGTTQINANSDITPAGTYYIVTAISSDGAIVNREFVKVEPPGGSQDIGNFTLAGLTPIAGSGVPATRLISTTAPLGGGGDLSADRTLTCTTSPVSSGTVVGTGRQIIAGAGLNGGGDLSADRTLALTAPVSIASGGTNNTAAYTAGSMIFSNGTSLTQDNANIFWDDTNFRLGIETATPAQPLHIAASVDSGVANNFNAARLDMTRTGSTADGRTWGGLLVNLTDSASTGANTFNGLRFIFTKSAGSGNSVAGSDSTMLLHNTVNETQTGAIRHITLEGPVVAAGKTLATSTAITIPNPSGAGTVTTAQGIVTGTTLLNGFGVSTPNVTMDVGGSFAARAGANIVLVNGLNSNVAVPLTGTMFRITGPTLAFQIGGLTNGFDGRIITLYTTVTGVVWTLNNADGSSTAANRITGTSNVTGTNCATAVLQYSATLTNWVILDMKSS